MSREPYINDQDFKLYVGDVREVLRDLPAESVHCVVTSPPYWGLRDYGTGEWEGGNEDCDHVQPVSFKSSTLGASTGGRSEETHARSIGAQASPYRDVCAKCGARRIDKQLGLERTPGEFVANMVEIFREIRRVLHKSGTVWLNLGDSYVSTPNGNKPGDFPTSSLTNPQRQERVRVSQVRDNKAVHGEVLRPYAVEGLAPKNLVGIPWRVAFALQDDGWYLRCDIIWAKPNPMPESATDRPTKSHEYIFMLTKSPRYFFDQEAVREPAAWSRWGKQTNDKHEGSGSAASWIKPKSKEELQSRATPTWEERKAAGAIRGNLAFGDNVGAGTQRGVHGEGLSHDLGDPAVGRNIRSVWSITTQPYAGAHFAVFPEELPHKCILAGTSETGCCPQCGAPWERIVETDNKWTHDGQDVRGFPVEGRTGNPQSSASLHRNKGGVYSSAVTLGWRAGCMCGHDPVPCVVLDPFMGSGTTAHVARKLGRHAIGIELNPSYAKLIANRTKQLSLFA